MKGRRAKLKPALKFVSITSLIDHETPIIVVVVVVVVVVVPAKVLRNENSQNGPSLASHSHFRRAPFGNTITDSDQIPTQCKPGSLEECNTAHK